MTNQKNTVIPNGEAIKQLRLSKGHTQESLTLGIKCSKTTLERLEKGKPAQITTLAIIARALEVDVNSLLVNNKIEDKIEGEPQKLKYLQLMSDALKINSDENSEWFRNTGPVAVDFRKGYVFERKTLLDELNKLVLHNKISILEGDAGTGKSVLIRNYAFNIIEKEKNIRIYHYSFKNDFAVDSFSDFLSILSDIDDLVIIEDIHLATQEMQNIVGCLSNKNNCHILLTAQSSFRDNLLKELPKTIKELPCLRLDSENNDIYTEDAGKLINLYAEKQCLQWTDEIKHAIRNVSNGDFWLLSYALKGCSGEGDPILWIKDGVMQDLRDVENNKAYKGNSEILIALSPLYMSEVLTAQSFLVKELGYERKEIDKLVSIGKVIKHKIDKEIFYGLPHSSIARAYWQYGDEYRNCLKYPDCGYFIYKYSASGASNGLRAILSLSQNTCLNILYNLFENGEALKVFQEEKDKTQYTRLIRALTHFLNHQEGQILFSNAFIRDFIKLLFERKCFTELQYFILASIHLPDIIKIASEYFVGILYRKDCFGDVCSFLSFICGMGKNDIPDFSTRIDFAKLASIVSFPAGHRQLANSIRYLFEIKEDLALNFRNEILKKYSKHPDWIGEWLNETCLYYKYLTKTHALVFLDDKSKQELRDKLFDIEEEICKRPLWPVADLKLRYDILQYLFEVNRSLGLEFWNELNKALFICGEDAEPDVTCLYLRDMSKMDSTIASELCRIIDCEKLALKANQSTDTLRVFNALQCLFEINRKLGLKFWRQIDKEQLVNGADVKLESICLFIREISKLDKEIESDLHNMINWEKLISKANQSADVSYVGQLFALLFELNKKLGMQFWEKLNKKEYARKLYESEIISIFSSFHWVFDIDKNIAEHFWEQYIDVSKLAAKVIEEFHSDPFVPEIITCFCQIYPKGAKKLCNQFDTAKLSKLLDRPYIGSDRRMRTIIVFAAYGSKITEDYHFVISHGVEEYANTLMHESYLGWEANNDKIGVTEPIAAKMLYGHICNKIGIDNFINHIKKSKSAELIEKCNMFFYTLDPDNEQRWRKYFDK